MAFALLVGLATAQELPRTKSPAGAKVRIVSPKDGDTVPRTFTVVFGLKGMGVAPAGADVKNIGNPYASISRSEFLICCHDRFSGTIGSIFRSRWTTGLRRLVMALGELLDDAAQRFDALDTSELAPYVPIGLEQ